MKMISKLRFTESPSLFPYFFNQDDFETALNKFGKFTTEIKVDEKLKMPKGVLIYAGGKLAGYINFWTYFLISETGKILLWKVHNEFELKFSIININRFRTTKDFEWNSDESFKFTDELQENLSINTSNLNIGANEFSFPDEFKTLSELIVFSRKQDVKYDLEFFERFVLLSIYPGDNLIVVTPFDEFNKTGGDYGYVWPAIANRELNSGNIYGSGMRMSNFIIKPNGELLYE
jgi:hypothetical protein